MNWTHTTAIYTSHIFYSYNNNYTSRISHTEKRGLIIFSLIGFSTFDVVYIAAVINYVAQSELLIDLLNGIKMLVEKGFPNDKNSGYENITIAMTVYIFVVFRFCHRLYILWFHEMF